MYVVRLTHTEVYFLSQIGSLKKEDDVAHFAQILWGVCAYYFWDKTGYIKKDQKLLETYFLTSFKRGENILGSILNKLEKFDFLEINREQVFENFLETRARLVSDFSPSVNLALPNSGIKKTKNSKYEIRFFWPESVKPEVYDIFGNLFDIKHYKKIIDKDTYFLGTGDINLKIRKKEAYIKRDLHDIPHISHVMAKEKIKLPRDIQTYTPIKVIKEKYVREFGHHMRIEFAVIRLCNCRFKTICFEADTLQALLGLSLLINPEQGEELTYTEFLNKYGRNKT